MSRRSFFLAVGILAFLTCAVGTTGVVLIRYEPRRYASVVMPPGPERVDFSQQFYTEFLQVISDATAPNGGRTWGASFTEKQINGYLNEGFVQSGLAERLLPERISEPRVVIEADRMRLAFRYGNSKLWSTVISVDFGAWVSKHEPNVLVLELLGFHAGALPISAQSLLESISQVGRESGIEVNWYRHEGNPVAVLRFQADQARPTLQLRAVRLEPGIISVQGGPGSEPSPARVTLSIPGTVLKPNE
jgi:hypothetical protein